MKFKHKGKASPLKFNWVGLLILVIGIEVPIRLLSNIHIPSCLALPGILTCLIALVGFFRQYDWKNILAALVIICTFDPIRITSHWWINPILYGSVAVICLLLSIYVVYKYSSKEYVLGLLLLLTVLSGWQMQLSTSEIDQCGIEDKRWTDYYYCSGTRTHYQQIQDLPIAMQGWCYYCPWHQGVGRWQAHPLKWCDSHNASLK